MKKPFTRPSTIFGRAASGLPSSRAVSSATRRSFSTVSAATSSRVQGRRANARCAARRRGRPASSPPSARHEDADLRAAGPCWSCAGRRDDRRPRRGPRGAPRSSRRWWRWPRRAAAWTVLPGSSSRAEQRLRVGGAGWRRPGEDLVGQGDWNVLALRDEVGLAVELDEGADAARRRGRRRGRWMAERPSRLAMPFRPLTRRISTALSRSPSASSSAFLTSIMPAPVCSRSALMSAAV